MSVIINLNIFEETFFQPLQDYLNEYGRLTVFLIVKVKTINHIGKEKALLRVFYTFCFLSLYLASMIVAPNLTHAYLKSKRESNDFLQAGYKVNWNKNENTFVVYDNFNHSETEKNQIIFPKSKFFNSVDLISIADPLPVVVNNFTTTENELADLLYANLKLKKLLEEYENFQEKSKKLIWNAQYLFQYKNDTNSIYQINKKIIGYSNKIAEKQSILVPNQTRSYGTPFDSYNSVRSNITPTFRNHILVNHDAKEPGSRETIASKKITNKPYREGSYPWIIRFFINLAEILPYLIANPLGALFYGICLYLTFLFIKLILKR